VPISPPSSVPWITGEVGSFEVRLPVAVSSENLWFVREAIPKFVGQFRDRLSPVPREKRLYLYKIARRIRQEVFDIFDGGVLDTTQRLFGVKRNMRGNDHIMPALQHMIVH
jgi:hypothetical protein